MDTVGFAVVGVQNFAGQYIENIRALEGEGLRLTGVVAERMGDTSRARELRGKGIKTFDTYEQLLRKGQVHTDVIGLPVSIPSHADMTIKAMKYGYDVLLEKPPAPTIGELDAIHRTAKRTSQFCSIGFQYIHSQSIRRLKRLILEGTIGELQGLACKGFWPRTNGYYQRNPWAGNLIHEGSLVLDGPVNNAFAHFLQNMLFLAGNEPNGSATPINVTAERYRANPNIQAADTACLNATTERGIDINFYVTHVPTRRRGPHMEVRGSEGSAELDYNGEVTVQTDEGERYTFDNGENEPGLEVLRTTAKYEQGVIDELYCTPCNTRGFVVTVNGSFESSGAGVSFPSSIVQTTRTDDGDVRYTVQGLEDQIDEAFDRRILLSETDVSWSKSTPQIDLVDYHRFTPFS